MKWSTTWFVLLLCISITQAQNHINREDIEKDFPYLENLYLDIHQHPELSFHEDRTASKLANELRKAGFEVTEHVGGTGIVGILKNGPGPVILVRTDLDALPIVEQTGADYASKVTVKNEQGNDVGVMHACGHDVHMTVWTGTARAMARNKDKWSGTLMFIGQPAEERGGGARNMLKDGLYQRFMVPDYALALHVNANLPAGKISYIPEYAMANVESMDIDVFGRGGHGAYPHTTIDPVVLAAKIILNIQTIVSREISPLEPAVITVGSIHGGTKHNIISDRVHLQLTLRSYTEATRQGIVQKIKRICKGEAIAAGLPENLWPKVTLADEFTPALYNNPDLISKVVASIRSEIGEKNVEQEKPVMGGEDFARYGKTDDHVPIFMFGLGAVPVEMYNEYKKEGKTLPSLHSSKFLPDRRPTILTGIEAMSAALVDLLKK